MTEGTLRCLLSVEPVVTVKSGCTRQVRLDGSGLSGVDGGWVLHRVSGKHRLLHHSDRLLRLDLALVVSGLSRSELSTYLPPA